MEKEFTIQCKMEERWIPHFLSLLSEMQSCGEIGHSEDVMFRADGDGDFRPKFFTTYPVTLVDAHRLSIAIHHPALNQNGEHCPPYDEEKRIKFYDAG